MSAFARTTTHLVSILIGLAVGGATIWSVFKLTLTPSEHDFQVRAAGHYAQQMSHSGVGRLASFRDCALEPPDPYQRLSGITWIGSCTTSARGTGYIYEVRLDAWARSRGAEFRVVPP